MKITPEKSGPALILFLSFFYLSCNINMLTNNVSDLDKPSYKWEKTQLAGPVQIAGFIESRGWTEGKWEITPDGRDQAQRLWLRIALPDNPVNEPALFIPNSVELFAVYIDGQKIYESGNVDSKQPAQFKGLKWHIVPLPAGSLKKTVYLRFYSTNKYLIGISTPVRYGPMNALLNWMLWQNSGRVLIATFNLLLGCITILGFTIVREKMFLYFGLLNLSLGVYFLIFSYAFQLVYDNPAVKMIVWELAIVASAIFLKYYFESLFFKSGILKYWLITLLVFLAGKYFFEGYPALSTWTILLNLILLTNPLICIYLSIRLAIKNIPGALIFSTGMFAVFILGAYNSFGHRFQHIEESNVFYGFFVIILVSGFISIKRHYTLLELTTRLEIESESFRKKMAETSLEKLEETISPAFFFNTLKLIQKLIMEKPELADETIRHLSDNYRYMTDSADKKQVLLAEEFQFLNNYFQILQLSSPGLFSVQTDYDETVDKIQVPPLSLYFIYELIEHLLKFSKNANNLIDISGTREKDGAKLTITIDNIFTYTNIIDNNKIHNFIERFKLLYKDVQTLYYTDTRSTTISVSFFNKIIE